MNYLAHIYLSGPDPQMQVGNFIGDAVKGSNYKHLPPTIAQGVLLHRAIDTYTDNHPTVKSLKQSMKPHFGRYSGVLLDIFSDYLLASHFNDYSDIPLRRFSRRFYLSLIRNRRHLPIRIRRFMWHFITTDRLSRYARTDGIRDSLDIMVNYGRLDIDVDAAIRYLTDNEQQLRTGFTPFFNELRTMCYNHLGTIDPEPYDQPQGGISYK